MNKTDRRAAWILLSMVRRKLYIKYELKKFFLNFFILNRKLPVIYRIKAQKIKTYLGNNHLRRKINNRCVISGRSKSVFSLTKTCRFVLRVKIYNSNLPGIRRYSF